MKDSKNRSSLIGIGGVSRAGKSVLAQRIHKILTGQGFTVNLICQDDFTVPKEHLPRIKDRIDWEHPDALDWSRLLDAVEESRSVFSFTIVEGILAFYHSSLASQFDLNVLVEIDKATFLERKQLDSRWGHEPSWFIEHIWSSYKRFGLPKERQYKRASGKNEISDHVIREWLLSLDIKA